VDDIKKLSHLIDHWLEHNAEHAKTYGDWAGRAEAAGRVELAGVLREIAGETVRMDELFEKAKELVS
jgi:hypothetical protein